MTDLRDRDDLPYRFFKPKNSDRWNMRFSISGFPQIKYALGTSDDDEALALAAEKYQDAAFQAKHGILAANGSFRSVAADYVKSLYANAERDPTKLNAAKQADAIVNRYLVEFFKTMAISAINHSTLARYTDWRRVYWTTGPGAHQNHKPYQRGGKTVHSKSKHEEPTNSTLRKEDAFLRGVFKHAVGKGLIKRGDVPQQEIPKVRINKRPAFSVEQYSKLVFASGQRIADVMDKPETFYARAMLNEFIQIAADTGMRPKEMFNLNWEHIEGLDLSGTTENFDTPISIHAYGKGKKPAPLIPKYTVVGNFRSIARIYRHRFGELPAPKSPVFCNVHGKRMTTFNKSLNALLDACDLRTDAFGRKFSSYSFRHYYATQAMRDPLMSVYKLAINMRTSVAMIERYYSDVIPADFASVLRGEHER